MAVPRPYPTNVKTREKPGPSGDERGTGTPQNTPCPAHEPRRLTAVPSMTLPVVTEPSGEMRGCGGRCGAAEPKSLRAGTGQDFPGPGCRPSPHAACRRGLGSEQRSGEGLGSGESGLDRRKAWSRHSWFCHLLVPVSAPVPHTHHSSVSWVSLTSAYDSSRP